MKYLLLLLILVSEANSFAQLNESDSVFWQLKVSSTGTVLDGNIARTLILNRLEVINANEHWGVSTKNDYQYGRTFHKLTENDFISYNFLYLRPFAQVYPYLMGLVETNLRRKIDFRYQIGPGISWNVINKKQTNLKLSFTGTFESTAFAGNVFEESFYSGCSSIDTWRLTGRIFGKHLFSDKIRVSYEFWFQQSLDKSVNYRYHTEETLEIPLTSRLAFRTALRYSYENIQLEGLKPYDLLWTFGLSYTRIK